MIKRETPSNLQNYLMVDSATSYILHSNGFIPKYINESGIYYIKNEKIVNFIRKEGLKCKN